MKVSIVEIPATALLYGRILVVCNSDQMKLHNNCPIVGDDSIDSEQLPIEGSCDCSVLVKDDEVLPSFISFHPSPPPRVHHTDNLPYYQHC